MFNRLKTFALLGIDGYAVDVEVDIRTGSHDFNLVGLPDNAVKESKERISSAIKNSQIPFPMEKITVNLAPADIKKEGASFDLPIAVAILYACGQLKGSCEHVLIGELSLDGKIRGVNGLLPLLISAKQQGYENFIIPKQNEKEAGFLLGINCLCAQNLKEIFEFFKFGTMLSQVEAGSYELTKQHDKFNNDFCDVKGQEFAKRALEIAAAGGHNVLMSGSPGTGKTMLAKCFPSILPELTFEEALEVTKIYSIAGELDYNSGIITQRPFRTPHHTSSRNALIGGGIKSKPGEISLAHNGVLYLDEMPEYPRSVLETLRQPLEDGRVIVSRTNLTIEYPAQFVLIGSMNPCPCGNFKNSKKECICSANTIKKYEARISSPLLDRIDLHIEVDNIEFEHLRTDKKAEKSEDIRKRVQKARQIQLERYGGKIFCNSRMTPDLLEKFCKIDAGSEQLLKNAFTKLNLSARGYTRVLKVARTVADIDGSEKIKLRHLAESIHYRSMEKR